MQTKHANKESIICSKKLVREVALLHCLKLDLVITSTQNECHGVKRVIKGASLELTLVIIKPANKNRWRCIRLKQK